MIAIRRLCKRGPLLHWVPMDPSGESMPRFHPLIATFFGITAWWICDGHGNWEHHLPMPYIDEPCIDHDEALELCAILNEENDHA